MKLKIISFSKGLSIIEYKNINPITKKIHKKILYDCFFKIFLIFGS